LTFQGEVVRVRLEEEPLRRIAGASKGEYLPGQTDPFPLERLLSLIGKWEGRELPVQVQVKEPVQRFEWFLLPSIALLLLEGMIGTRRRSPVEQHRSIGPHWLVRLTPRRSEPDQIIAKGDGP
jgi:hypothetical protein